MEGLRTGGRIRVNVLHGIIQCESRCKSHRVDQGEKGAETVRAHTRNFAHGERTSDRVVFKEGALSGRASGDSLLLQRCPKIRVFIRAFSHVCLRTLILSLPPSSLVEEHTDTAGSAPASRRHLPWRTTPIRRAGRSRGRKPNHG